METADVRSPAHAERDRLRLLTRLIQAQSVAHRIALAARDRASLLARVCEAVTSSDAFAAAWCGWKLADHRVEPVAAAGPALGERETLRVRWDDGPLGRGPVGTALRTGATVVRRTIGDDRRFDPWREAVRKRGLSAGAAVPLRLRGEVVGALCVYLAGEPELDDVVIGAIEEIGGIVELGLERLEAEGERQATTERLSRLAAAVERAAEGVLATSAEGVLDRSATYARIAREDDLDAQLRHLQKVEALGQLTGGIAHDFNNLLGIVLTNASFLREEIGERLEPEQRRALGDLEAAAGAGASLVRKLLSLGRRDRVEPVPFDVHEALGRVAGMLRRVIPAEIEIVLEGEPGHVAHGDPGSFDQILVNLATNARDAMPCGGRLRLTVDRAEPPGARPDPLVEPPSALGGCVRVRVEDDGEGMSPAVLARAFEPFFTTKAPDAGTGLGLPMVASLMRQQGGDVRVVSEPGAGTVVELYYRRAEAAEGDRQSARAAAVFAGTETVLVVEDDPRMRRATVRTLERLGYAVLTAADGVEAMQAWEASHDSIDAVLTDGGMPRLGGVDLAYALRESGSDVPVLLVSGTGEASLPAELEAAGVRRLGKPWTVEALGGMLRAALDERAPRR